MENETSMIVVHHLNNSRSQRVLWLLEELGLEYEIKRYQRDPQTMLAPQPLPAERLPKSRQTCVPVAQFVMPVLHGVGLVVQFVLAVQTPHIPALYACQPGLEILNKAGIEAIRVKSIAMTTRSSAFALRR